MNLVLGITGQTGGATADALLSQGHNVRALVRDPARAGDWARRGVEIVQGEASDRNALEAAMAGVEGAFVLVPPAPQHPDPMGWAEDVATAVRDAARAAGLPRLVLLSSEGAHLPAGTGPVRTLHRAEAILAGVADRTSILRPSFFLENWRNVLPVARAEGVMPSMLSDLSGKRPMVPTADIGEAAAALLLDAEPAALVELAGAEDLSPRDVAAVMAGALGRPVEAVAPPRDARFGILTGAGLGRAYAELLVEMYDGIESGHMRFSGEVPLSRGRADQRQVIESWVAGEVRARNEVA